MRYSNYFLPTIKETPADADTVSSKLMMRSGMIRKLSSGIYEWLPMGLRVLKKVEEIVRQEMNKINGQEVSLPLLLPKSLWVESKRWDLYGSELFRLKDRKESEFCLGPTHEEAVTDLVRREVRSYRQLPLMLYQFGTKFRDEIRPRFGVMRAREFYMKDAYSFHATESDIDSYYKMVFDAYSRICERCGLKYRSVEAATGAIGGKFSHEFMILSDTGEAEIAYCESCGYASNIEKAECPRTSPLTGISFAPLEEVHTPGMRTVEEVRNFMKEPPEKFIKTLIYTSGKTPVMVLVRGDYEINENKLMEHFPDGELKLADAETIERVTGAPVGFAGPANLKEKIRIIADCSVEHILNGITGANKKDHHLKNVNPGRDFMADEIADLRNIAKGDSCTRCSKPGINFTRGIEVGHTFKLGTKYSKSMNADFLDAQGQHQNFIMGCYGIGVSRIVAAAIEQSHDDNGIIWPLNIAPFKVIIVPVDYNDKATKETSDRIYSELSGMGIETMIDDREERPGIKFKDADLIGIPLRITIGSRNLPENVELKSRTEPKATLVKVTDITKRITEILK